MTLAGTELGTTLFVPRPGIFSREYFVPPRMTAKPVKRNKVEASLAAVAKAFNEAHRGHHSYSPIWEVRDHPSCNWSSTYACRGSQISLSEMRAALKRVQEKYPIVDFG